MLLVSWKMWRYNVFFFKQKTADEMRIRDWSSDVCSSDLLMAGIEPPKTWADLLDPRFKGKMVKAHPGYSGTIMTANHVQIGRASCRERSVRVDLGGRRLIKKKNTSFHPEKTR